MKGIKSSEHLCSLQKVEFRTLAAPAVTTAWPGGLDVRSRKWDAMSCLSCCVREGPEAEDWTLAHVNGRYKRERPRLGASLRQAAAHCGSSTRRQPGNLS